MEKHEPCETDVGGDWMSEEEIDYNLMGTFPASDPPSTDPNPDDHDAVVREPAQDDDDD